MLFSPWYFFLIVSTFIFAELTAYLLHRYFGHNQSIWLFGMAHKEHHEKLDDALFDFIIVGFIMLSSFVAIGLLWYFELIPLFLAGLLLTTMLFVYLLNWYIHQAYHKQGHWLESYEWFLNGRQTHLIHHKDHTKNYGLLTYFTDKAFGTYQAPMICEIKFK